MVDRELIYRKISLAREYREQIREYSGISVSRYEKDWKVQRIVERTLQMMIEICIDIAAHIVSDAKFRTPKNYVDTFYVLQENGVISRSLFETLEKMVKCRNFIVHQYDQIDPAVIVTILNRHLADFTAFESQILDYADPE